MPAPEAANTNGGSHHEFRCYHPVAAGTTDRELVELARAATHTETPLHVEETS
jgi:peptide/nickel transport system ATP-binding protein